MSPVSSTFGHDPAERSYCTLAVPEDHNLKALVHRVARHHDRIGTIQEQTILGSQFPCHSHNSPSSYTGLELIVPALQVPLQLSQLEALLRCLHETPDVHQPLATTGYPVFSHLASLFFEHLSSRDHAPGGESGGDILRALNECFRHLIDRGADPNILVGGSPLLFRLLGAPAETGAFGPMWDCVQRLAKRALLVGQQQQQQGYSNGGGTKAPPNALHVLLEGASSSSASASAAMTASEAQNRVHLTTAVLIPHLAALGRLDDRGGGHGLSAFGLYVRGFAARDDMCHFLQVSAEFVRHGASTGGDGDGDMVPPGFAGDVRAACRTGALGTRLQDHHHHHHHRGGGGVGGAAAALWATVWVSACQLSLLGGDEAVVEDHLSVLEYCTEGQARADVCRFMLPRPPPPPPPSSQLQSVDLAGSATGSEGSEEGDYTW